VATLFDGITRHSPEGMWFKQFAEKEGFQSAVAHRDSGQAIPEGSEARAATKKLQDE
jgi:enoyl-CoA hydratase